MQYFYRIVISLSLILSISMVRAEYVETTGQITIEAEDYLALTAPGTTNDFWAAKCNRGNFSGDASMFVGPNDGDKVNGPSETIPGSPADQSPRLSYHINFSTNGTYKIWLKVLGTGGGGNSVHVGVDNNFVGIIGFAAETDFTWVNTNAVVGSPPLTFVISDAPATHRFDLWMREDGVYIDKILLTTNPTADPTTAEPLADNPTAIGAVAPTAAAPVITPPGGAISPAATVSLSTCTSNTGLFYTLDGSDPTPNFSNPSTVQFATGFMIPADNTVVRAIASALPGTTRNNSAITSATFTINPAPTF